MTFKARIAEYDITNSPFEPDHVFTIDSEFLPNLIAAYKDAKERAARAARHAVLSGDLPSMRSAQWYAAVEETLYRVLSMMAGDNSAMSYPTEEFSAPEKPDFREYRAVGFDV